MELNVAEMLQGANNYRWVATEPLPPFRASGRPLYRSYKNTKRVDRLNEYYVFIIEQGCQQMFVVKDLSFFHHLLDCFDFNDNSVGIIRTGRRLAIFESSDPQVDSHFKTFKGIILEFLSYFAIVSFEPHSSYFIENLSGTGLVHFNQYANYITRFETEASRMFPHGE